jgi:hypothetical protein
MNRTLLLVYIYPIDLHIDPYSNLIGREKHRGRVRGRSK